MPTYNEYLIYAASKQFQPLGETAFNSLIKCGFNPITKEFN